MKRKRYQSYSDIHILISQVLSGALFEPQTTIKVSVVSDTTNSSSSISSSSSSSGNGNSGSNGTKNSITPQKAVTK
jgi:hypothetical protein